MSEVPDEKLSELIERYVEKCIFYYKNEDIDIEISKKAKQAIIDYHDKKVQDAMKHIRREIDALIDLVNSIIDAVNSQKYFHSVELLLCLKNRLIKIEDEEKAKSG